MSSRSKTWAAIPSSTYLYQVTWLRQNSKLPPQLKSMLHTPLGQCWKAVGIFIEWKRIHHGLASLRRKLCDHSVCTPLWSFPLHLNLVSLALYPRAQFEVQTEKPSSDGFLAKPPNPVYKARPHHAKLRARQVFHLRCPDGLFGLATFLDLVVTIAPSPFTTLSCSSCTMRTALDSVIHRVPWTKLTCLSITRRPLWLGLSRLFFTCNNANQAASNTCNNRPKRQSTDPQTHLVLIYSSNWVNQNYMMNKTLKTCSQSLPTKLVL
jgi:hypothetical protein